MEHGSGLEGLSDKQCYNSKNFGAKLFKEKLGELAVVSEAENWDLYPSKLRARIAFPPGKENPIFLTSYLPGNPVSAPKVICWTVTFVYKVHGVLLVI